MSESPIEEPSGPADGAVPRDLTALVEDLALWRQAPVANTHLIAISVTNALPENMRAPELVEQVNNAMAEHALLARGQYYRTTPGDFVILVTANERSIIGLVRDLKVSLLRLIEKHFLGSFGKIEQTRLVVSYDLNRNYRSAAERVSRYAGAVQRLLDAGQAKKLRPLTRADIEKVTAAYKQFGAERFVKTFVRHQNAVKAEPGKPLEPLIGEFFISMDLLRKPLFIDVEMRGSGQLFNEFTLTLDQILLEAVGSPGTELEFAL